MNTLTSQNQLTELFNKGIEFASHHKYKEALDVFIEMLNTNPEQPLVVYNAAVMCDLLNESATALEVLDNAISLKPDFSEALFYKGKILYNSDKFENAARYFKEAVRHNINYNLAIQFYQASINKLGKSLIDYETDIVFYIIGGKPFHGNSLEEGGLGGSESALIYISRELTKLGYRIKVFTECNQPGSYNGIEYYDLTDFYLYKSFNKIKTFISVRSLRPFLTGINADLKLFWIHDNPNVELTENVLNQIDRIISISEWQKKAWQKEYNIPAAKFTVIPNGVDSSLFDNNGTKRNTKKMVYLSQPHRGLENLLKMFPGIKEKVPEAELHLFWYESEAAHNYWEEMKKDFMIPGVYYRGSLNKKDLADELATARLMVYPTHVLENFCIAAVEAQAASVPVISSNLAGLMETVLHDKTGILIEGLPESKEFQEKFVNHVVDLLLDDEKWNSFSRQACVYARDKYDWKKVAGYWEMELSKNSV